MQYLFCFLLSLAVWVSPLSVKAEDTREESTTSSEPWRHPHDRRRPPVSPESNEVAIEYVEPATRAIRTAQAKQAVARHRGGLIASSVTLGVGIVFLAGAGVSARNAEAPEGAWVYIPVGPIVLGSLGVAMAVGGIVGMAVTGSRMGARKRELDELQRGHSEKPRRARWNVVRSRLEF